MPRFKLILVLGLLSPVLGTYVHLTEKCFGTASHSYCTRFYPSNYKGCLVRLDKRNLVMNAEDSSICYIGSSSGKCISNEVCYGSETQCSRKFVFPKIYEECDLCRKFCPKLRCNRDLDRIPRYWVQKDDNRVVAFFGVHGLPVPIATPSTAATTARSTSTPTPTTTTTTTRQPPVMDNDKDSMQEPEPALDDDLSKEWPFQHSETNWSTDTTRHEPNPFSVLGLATPIEVVLFGTLIALGAMLILYMILLGCQLSFVRTQKRTYDLLEVTLNKTFKHLTDIEEGMQERSLRVASTINSDSPAILPTLPAQNSFQPNGTSPLSRAGSTGAIPKSSQAKSARGTGGLFGSLTRAKPPTAPPAPPLAPRRSQRSSPGYRRVQNSLPALDQYEEFEMEESHV